MPSPMVRVNLCPSSTAVGHALGRGPRAVRWSAVASSTFSSSGPWILRSGARVCVTTARFWCSCRNAQAPADRPGGVSVAVSCRAGSHSGAAPGLRERAGCPGRAHRGWAGSRSFPIALLRDRGARIQEAFTEGVPVFGCMTSSRSDEPVRRPRTLTSSPSPRGRRRRRPCPGRGAWPRVRAPRSPGPGGTPCPREV